MEKRLELGQSSIPMNICPLHNFSKLYNLRRLMRRPLWLQPLALPTFILLFQLTIRGSFGKPHHGLLTESTFYYANYKIPALPISVKTNFLPDPQNCPETGRTLCKEVKTYPSDKVLEVITSVKPSKFNFTSLFVDESDNDPEPQFKEPEYSKPREGYVVYQSSLHYDYVPHSQYYPNYVKHLVEQQTSYSNTQTGTVPASAAAGAVPGEQVLSIVPKAVIDSNKYRDGQLVHAVAMPVAAKLRANIEHLHKVLGSGPLFLHIPTQASLSKDSPQVGTEPSKARGRESSKAARNRNSHVNLRKSNSFGLNPENVNGGAWKPVLTKPVSPQSSPQVYRDAALGLNSYHGPFGYDMPSVDSISIPGHSGRAKRQTRNSPSTGGDTEEICRTRSMFVTPKAALNDKSEWRFIVNLGEKDPKLKQVVKVDVCSSPGEICSNEITLPFGYLSRCKQKYIKKKLLSLDPDGQGTSTENFFVPSCCVCEIVRTKRK